MAISPRVCCRWASIALIIVLAGTAARLFADDAPQSPPKLAWNAALSNWHVAGPIAKLDAKNDELDRQLVEYEAELQPSAPVVVGNKTYEWKRRHTTIINFPRALDASRDAANNNALAYAYTKFTCDADQDALLAVQHDDGAVVWLNGAEVYRNKANTASSLDQSVVKVSLKAGTNTLLAKIANGSGAWEFAARLRPLDFEEPLLSIPLVGKGNGDASRIPQLHIDLLDDAGNALDTLLLGGGRWRKGGYRYTAFTSPPKSAPATLRIHYDEPGLVSFDKSFPWSEASAGNIELQLVAAAPIRGTVVDADTKVPVKSPQLRFDPGDQTDFGDNDGRFEIKNYDPLIQFVAVAAAGYEPERLQVPWPPRDDWTINLSRGGRVVRGRVLDSDGKPLAGAKISAYGNNSQVNQTTDDKGRFEIVDIPRRTSMIYPTVTCDGYIPKGGFNLRLDSNRPTEIEWRLERGATVTGRVTAKDDGHPLVNITITSGSDRFVSNDASPSTKTDADGRYTLSGTQPAPGLLHAFSDDFAPSQQSVTPTMNGPTTADFQLEPGAAVTGRVTDPDGKPVPDVWIITDTWNNARMFRREQHTDADGKFTLAHMPADGVRTEVLKQGYVSLRSQNFVSGQHYDLTLSPVVERIVKVKLSDDDVPPKEVTLQLGYQWQGQPQVNWEDSNYNRIGKYQPSDGSIHIREDESNNAKRLLRLRVPGYHDAVIPLPTSPTEQLPAEVTLEKTETSTARVVDANTGAPLAAVTVMFANPQDRLRMDQYADFNQIEQAIKNFTGFRTVTVADGTFEFPALGKNESPELVLLGKDGGFLVVPSAAVLLAEKQFDIPFPKACTISGRITAGGQPLADEQIHLSWLPPGDVQNPWELPFGYGGQIKTDRNGRFKFSGLGSGRYQIARMKSFSDPGNRSSMSRYLTTEELVILPGQNLTRDFALPTGCIVTGQILDDAGKPVANCMVSASGSGQRSQTVDMTQSDADGYFTLTYLAPGKYNLTAEHYVQEPNRPFMPGARGNKSIKVANGLNPPVTVKLQKQDERGLAVNLRNRQPTLFGSTAPDFTGKFLDKDESFTLSDHIGQVVVVSFWAGGNEPGMAAAAGLQQLYEKYKDNADVAFVTICIDQDADMLRRNIEQNKIGFPVIFQGRDETMKLAMSFGPLRIPSTYVIDREGKFASDAARGDAITAAIKTALDKPLDPALTEGDKPSRLTIKLTLDKEATSVPGTTITVKAIDADGHVVREETIDVAGQASQFVSMYPKKLSEGGKIHITAEAEGCPKQEAVLPNPTDRTDVTFDFSSPRTISGRIAADDGATPVPNMKVMAYRNDAMRRNFNRAATTDANGEFKINVFPGTYYLSYSGTEDFAPVGIEREEVDVDAESDPQPVIIEACRAIAITGTVNDPDGKPIAGAQVRTGANAKAALTDANGHFELSGVASRGRVMFLATKQPLFTQTELSDLDPDVPITLTLQPRNDQQQMAAGLTGKMPRLALHNVIHDEPIDWQPAPDTNTLIAFCSLWHPAGRNLAQRAEKWAADHHTYVTIVSTDWSLEEARRRWIALDLKPLTAASPLYAGPGGIELTKEWKLASPAQAYLISPQGKVIKTLDPDKME